ncbi:hypothetical protein U1Q18_048641 [Sarracenia purpurea var. burkii]
MLFDMRRDRICTGEDLTSVLIKMTPQGVASQTPVASTSAAPASTTPVAPIPLAQVQQPVAQAQGPTAPVPSASIPATQPAALQLPLFLLLQHQLIAHPPSSTRDPLFN